MGESRLPNHDGYDFSGCLFVLVIVGDHFFGSWVVECCRDFETKGEVPRPLLGT
jgi:hypothetical protein